MQQRHLIVQSFSRAWPGLFQRDSQTPAPSLQARLFPVMARSAGSRKSLRCQSRVPSTAQLPHQPQQYPPAKHACVCMPLLAPTWWIRSPSPSQLLQPHATGRGESCEASATIWMTTCLQISTNGLTDPAGPDHWLFCGRSWPVRAWSLICPNFAEKPLMPWCRWLKSSRDCHDSHARPQPILEPLTRRRRMFGLRSYITFQI